MNGPEGLRGPRDKPIESSRNKTEKELKNDLLIKDVKKPAERLFNSPIEVGFEENPLLKREITPNFEVAKAAEMRELINKVNSRQ